MTASTMFDVSSPPIKHESPTYQGEQLPISNAETGYREAHLPPLSREHPRPDPLALKEARILETLVMHVGAIASRIRSLPVPENDRITQRHRQEADTLERLLQADMALVGHAEALSRGLREQSPDWIVQHAEDLTTHVAVIDAALRDRQSILSL